MREEREDAIRAAVAGAYGVLWMAALHVRGAIQPDEFRACHALSLSLMEALPDEALDGFSGRMLGVLDAWTFGLGMTPDDVRVLFAWNGWLRAQQGRRRDSVKLVKAAV